MTKQYAPEVSLRSRTRLGADALVIGAVIVLFYLLIRLSYDATAPIAHLPVARDFDTSPARLPYYALRSLLRMFAALVASTIFTFIYATIAARSRRAEKILIPLLDILQSVPVLGFLSITLTIWLRMFPGSEMGVEFASIFAIFTSQVWNMTFAFYQSQTTVPKELDEASRLMRQTRWQRFWQLDAPHGVIPLVWNGMMSFGGGWFFLIASEVIAVNNNEYALPGIGSYVAAASEHEQMGRILLAILVMVIMVIAVNFIFWRPLTAWAERFRLGDNKGTDEQKSWVLSIIRHSAIPGLIVKAGPRTRKIFDGATRPFGLAEPPLVVNQTRRRAGDWVFGVVVGALLLFGLWRMFTYLNGSVGLAEFGHAFALGLLTFVRVIILTVVSTLIWVPIGVWIGLNPKVTRFAQPIVQILASFPANFLFPFITMFLLATHISLNIGGIFLMALGAQWYILFNVIAGAAAIPNDLKEAATNFRLSRWEKWRNLYGPAVLASWVTGGITAAGGAWNASIVAEVVSYGQTTLIADGLGAYITEATEVGDFPKVLIGVIVMSIFVVGLNRIFWKRLYNWAERRFSYA